MRKTLMFAVVAAALSAASLSASAASPINPAPLSAAADQLGGVETVARVCRERCERGVCKKVCRDDENFGRRDRHHRRWEGRRHRHHDHDRGPGIRLELR
jgi:hypothetical protein